MLPEVRPVTVVTGVAVASGAATAAYLAERGHDLVLSNLLDGPAAEELGIVSGLVTSAGSTAHIAGGR